MQKFLMLLAVTFGVSAFTQADQLSQNYQCTENCSEGVGEGGLLSEDLNAEALALLENHQRHPRDPRYRPPRRRHPQPPPRHHYSVTCYTRNNYGWQFYGTSYDLHWARNIAFQVCYQNSMYPQSCHLLGCYYH